MKKNINFTILVCFIFLAFMSCDKKEDSTDCDDTLITSPIIDVAYPNDDVTIISASITEDCLSIKYGASGCDGNSWDVELLDANKVDGISNPQITLRLSLDNKEECEAYITKERSFDISVIQVDDLNQVQFILMGYDELLEYNY